jgi:iron complex outermembrane receptor protein
MRKQFQVVAACGVSAIATTTSLFAQTPAFAQTTGNAPLAAHAPPPVASDTSAVEEIVVTARQRSESLKNVPASVSVLTAATLRAAGVARVDDVIALTPGVSIVNGAAEQADTQVNIRGSNSARDADPSFSYVVDGIQIANPAAFNRELTDLSQIEVVKGPQGALYGRNASAGAIIVTTEKPTDVESGSFETSAGDYGSYTFKGRIAGPLTSKLDGSLSVDYRSTDGQYRNSLFTSQPALDSFQGGDINGRLIYTFDAASTLDFKMHYGQLTSGSINYNAAFELPGFAKLTGVGTYYENVNDHKYYYDNDVPNVDYQNSLDGSVKFDHDFGWAHLTAWGLLSSINEDLLADGASASFGFFNTAPTCINSVASLYGKGVQLPSPQNLGSTPGASFFGPYTPTTCDGYQYQRRDQTDVSAEVRLSSRSDQPLRWMTGLYYLYVNHTVGVATGIDSGGAPPRSLYVPSGQPYATEQLLDDRFIGNLGAGFGQVQYDFIPGLEGSAALRFDSDTAEDHNLVPTSARSEYIDFTGPPYVGGAPLNPGLDPALNPAGISNKSKTFSQFEPKVSLRWAASPDWSVYGDWGVGFKSGGFNNQGSAATIDAFINPIRTASGYSPVDISDEYKKEVSTQGEIGVKGRLFDGKLTLDAAVYDTDVKNMQFFEFFVGPFGLLRVVSNIDDVSLDGAEFGAQYKATRYLTFSGSAAYTYSRINKNNVRPDTVGNESPYTPQYTWNLATQYDRPLFGDVKLHSRLDVRGTGPTWFSDVQKQSEPTVFEATFGALGLGNYAKTERDAFATVNLHVGLERENWTFTVYGTNILNKQYLSEVIPAPEFGGAFVSPAQGSRFGATLGYRF